MLALKTLSSFYPPSGAEMCNLLHALNWLSPLIPIQVVSVLTYDLLTVCSSILMCYAHLYHTPCSLPIYSSQFIVHHPPI